MKPLRPTQGDTIKPKRVRKPVVRKATMVPADLPVLSLQVQSTIPTASDSNNPAQSSEPSMPTVGPSTQAPFSHTSAARQKKQTKAQSTLPKMQQAQNSAEHSRQHTPAASKRRATTEKTQPTADGTQPARDEQPSSSTSAKRKKAK
ncbi:hypothetical protein HWV62_34845 [Athelia sp. TMB]|nr:hypothetical protein HWV62_34845 [Athelia sp. TMB]